MSDHAATYGVSVFIDAKINDLQFEPKPGPILTILELFDVDFAGATLPADHFDLDICCSFQTGPASSAFTCVLACVMDQNWHRLCCVCQPSAAM